MPLLLCVNMLLRIIGVGNFFAQLADMAHSRSLFQKSFPANILIELLFGQTAKITLLFLKKRINIEIFGANQVLRTK